MARTTEAELRVAEAEAKLAVARARLSQALKAREQAGLEADAAYREVLLTSALVIEARHEAED